MVRKMKQHKTLEHGALVSEVIQQLPARYSERDITQCIEELIDREYLAGTLNEAYTYVP